MRSLLLAPFRFIRFVLVSMFLAVGQIWANKTRSVLAALGIVIGIASVTAVIAALTGLKQNVLSEFESFGTNKMFVYPRTPSEGPKSNAPWSEISFQPRHFRGMLEHTPSVRSFTRIGSSNQEVSYDDQSLESADIKGIDPAWHDIEGRGVSAGRPFSVVDDYNARPVCLITETTRDELRLPRDPVGESIYMFDRRFEVVGIVEPPRDASGMFGGSGLSNEVFIPFQTLWDVSTPFMSVICNARSPEVANEARAEVRFFLRQSRDLAPDEPDTFHVEVMSEFLDQFNAMAAGVTAVAGGIVSVSLLVGGIGIMNIMLVSVSERTREIGLRKAVGARPSAILLQFLIEACTLCTFGGLLGILAGQGLTEAIKQIPDAQLDQAHIPIWAVVLSLAFSGSVGVAFGLFPAIKAARLNPIEALRHE
ncbi:MAG: ABC transporter permease [Phycisphaeraceae bacterium]|nr:ABC transporter permease [Phycisphaeraceae bacterium]